MPTPRAVRQTKKAFREYLNKLDMESQAKGLGKHKHGPYHQLKRLYGDYLYSQDREKFNVDYQEWLTTASEDK